jgi:N-methylhydantoinase A
VSKSQEKNKTYYCYTDAGGTFTDSFVIDEEGNYASGKASSTPQQLADGHMSSLEVALDKFGVEEREFLNNAEVVGFGTTAIINTVLTRSGIKSGAIVSKGFEQLPYIGRGAQTMTEYSWEDVLHYNTHRHLDDLIPPQLIEGVTERTDSLGDIMIPLYEHEVYEAAKTLIAQDVKAIVIMFLYSHLNPKHELRAKEIVQEEIDKAGKTIELFTSVETAPVHRELNRFNSVAIEAYGGSIARKSMRESENRLRENGSKTPLQITLSQGGLSSVSQAKMIETAMSGPVGGLMGGRFIGEMYGIENIITSDVGGTSFDVGLLSAGRYMLNMEPLIAKFMINIPYVQVSSIGAGGGTIAYVDKLVGRLQVGPKSAGAVPGPSCYGLGGTNATVTDADVILGYIDPDFFLGGRVKLNKALAEKTIKEQIADPLGIDAVRAAWGIKEIIDTQMENYCRSLISSKGYAVEDYTMMAFGGAGPTHCFGYVKNTNYKNVMMFPFSSVFCAFGASAADFAHHYIRSCRLYLPFRADDETKMEVGKLYNTLITDLKEQAIKQFTEEGYDISQMEFLPHAYLRYNGQLEDIKVTMPMTEVKSVEDMDIFWNTFEEEYSRIFTSQARYSEAGILGLSLGLTALVKKAKPRLVKHKLQSGDPAPEAMKFARKAYFGDRFYDTAVYDMDKLKAGNVIHGPAVVEHIDTNYVVPPGSKLEFDEYMTLWYKKGAK